jgi:hypothetical protein
VLQLNSKDQQGFAQVQTWPSNLHGSQRVKSSEIQC